MPSNSFIISRFNFSASGSLPTKHVPSKGVRHLLKDALSPEEQVKLEDYSGYAEEARGKATSQKNTGHIMVVAGGLLALAGLVTLLKKKKV